MLKTILIAANDPNIIYLLRRYAEASGFRVERCDFGEDLQRLARQVNPVLILLEIEPPQANWRPHLQRLKSDQLTRTIPVVAYSYFDEMDCDPGDDLAGFLHKSVMYNDFISVLDKAGVHPVDSAV
jgi:CheY-like chemotaxis protein